MSKISIRDIMKWRLDGKLDRCLASSATSKNHKHLHNSTFKSINRTGVSPAQYRHDHLVMRNGKLYKKVKKHETKLRYK